MSEGSWMPQLRLLVEVDQLDRAILRAKQRRDALRAESKASKAELEAKAAELAALDASLKALEIAQQKRETDLKWTLERLKRIGSFEHVTNEKELLVAQREVDSLKQQRDALELAQFEGLEQQEKDEQRRGVLQHALERLKRDSAVAQAERKVQFEAEGVALERAKADRAPLLPQFLPELKDAYEHAYLLHGDRACCTVHNDLCPNCKITVQAQHIVNILLGKSFHICQHCKRLLLPDRPL